MGNGKKTKAPCGCPGEHVFGNYIECLKKCDKSGVPKGVITETTEKFFVAPLRRCPFCNSDEVDEFGAISSASGDVWFHCWACSKVFP